MGAEQSRAGGATSMEEANAKEVLSTTTELQKGPMHPSSTVPHKYHAIIKEAANPSTAALGEHIYSGIFLNNGRKKYWVDKKTSNNCFMLFARDLSITWSEDPRYWHWHSVKETSDVEIDVASLFAVCWLEVHGKFETSYLTPGVMYEILFVVMIKEPAYGWSVPVNLRLKLPDGKVQERKERLQEKPRGQWIEIKVGEFVVNFEQGGEMEISLFEYEGGQWKRGLIIKGVIIRPKK